MKGLGLAGYAGGKAYEQRAVDTFLDGEAHPRLVISEARIRGRDDVTLPL